MLDEAGFARHGMRRIRGKIPPQVVLPVLSLMPQTNHVHCLCSEILAHFPAGPSRHRFPDRPWPTPGWPWAAQLSSAPWSFGCFWEHRGGCQLRLSLDSRLCGCGCCLELPPPEKAGISYLGQTCSSGNRVTDWSSCASSFSCS